MNRQQFEDAIAADPYNKALHMEFAEFLEEQGADDEAAWQLAWTAKRQESEDWLRAFVTGGEHVTFEDMVAAVRKYVETGEGDTLGNDLGFGMCNQYYDNEVEFWQHWETWSQTTVETARKIESPFSCCY